LSAKVRNGSSVLPTEAGHLSVDGRTKRFHHGHGSRTCSFGSGAEVTAPAVARSLQQACLPLVAARRGHE
jgi:hypothetical protein